MTPPSPSSKPSDASQPLSPAEELYAQYLTRRQQGATLDIDAWCASHPDHAADLRKLDAQYGQLSSIFERLMGSQPAPEKRLADELRERYGEGVDPGISLDGGGASQSDSGPSSELLRRLRTHAPKNSRYKLQGEIGRGGMGAVIRVWDEDLRRTLAMKVVLGKEDKAAKGATPPVDSRTLGRFLEEAQITGQLDHPGIVPVHELGLGADGQVYFTMRLVKGEDLKQVFGHVESGHDGWNTARALGVMLKVCEAMAYAHAKGVIHRDLKPANIMVGRYGEVYVMDWGLARVAGTKDLHDLRIKNAGGTSQSVRTERREERDEAPDSPIVTMDGDVMGTPAYMPPEQARGDIAQLGPHSDVYAVGAMLYHLLLVKHIEMPYVAKGARASARAVLLRVLEEGPKGILSYEKNAPAPLIAIVEKAMARELGRRYPDMESLAGDLRAYIEGRVVKAYETGTWAETKQWVKRNKPLAASIAAGVLVLLVGSGLVLRESARANANALLANQRATEAEQERNRASDQTRIAVEQRKNADESARIANEERERTAVANAKLREQAREQQLRGMIQELARFRAQCRTLEGLDRLGKPAYRWWLDESAKLLDGQAEDPEAGVEWRPGRKDVQAKLAELRGAALDYTEADRARDEATHPVQARIRGLESSRDMELDAIKTRLEDAPLEAKELLEIRIAYSELRLGAKAWPSDADVAKANAERLQSTDVLQLNRQAWTSVDPDGSLGTAEQLVLAMLLAKRGVELPPSDVVYRVRTYTGEPGDEKVKLSSSGGAHEVRHTYAWSLTWLGRGPEALAAIDSAIAVAGDARPLIEASKTRIEQELARWAEAELPTRQAELVAWRKELAAWASPADLESRIASEQAPVRARYESHLASLRAESKERRTWRFADSQQEWWHAQLAALDGELSWLATMREAAFASTESELAKARWSEAIEGIARSPKYAGQRWPSGDRLTPQAGLLPLGANPVTGLWEFVHLQTGVEPTLGADGRVLRDAEGRLTLTPETGMVLVLLPGGRVPVADNVDHRQADWIPRVDLSPFFLSKYELTVEQWDRVSIPRHRLAVRPYTRGKTMTPMNNISWDDISALWPRELGWCGFPSETQWEYGCRGGTATTWWTGNDEDALKGAGNAIYGRYGSTSIAPVGALRANAFGLHDVHGNVWEVCGDTYRATADPRTGDGLRDDGVDGSSSRVRRGGGFADAASVARSADRSLTFPGGRDNYLGLRPSRGITP